MIRLKFKGLTVGHDMYVDSVEDYLRGKSPRVRNRVRESLHGLASLLSEGRAS